MTHSNFRTPSLWVALVLVTASGQVKAQDSDGEIEVQSTVIADGSTFYYDLALSDSGEAHVVYADGRIDIVYYTSNMGGQWNDPVYVDLASDVSSTALSIGVDANNRAHIAYDSGSLSFDTFSYASNVSGAWIIQDVRGRSRWYSLALDSVNLPGVAYYHDNSGLNIANFDGTFWHHLNLDDTGGIATFSGRFPDLAFDDNNAGHIVYYNFESDAFRYAVNSSGVWVWEEFLTSPTSPYCRLELDSKNQPIVAYEKQGYMWISRKENGRWNPVKIGRTSEFTNHDLALDADDTPYVLYNAKSRLTLAGEGVEPRQVFDITEARYHLAGGWKPVLRIDGNQMMALVWDRNLENLYFLQGALQLGIDDDGDGVPNGDDVCPNSDLRPTVIIDDCDSGVTNILLVDGCTISDLISECRDEFSNHGEFVEFIRCVSRITHDLKKNKIISSRDKRRIRRCAWRVGFNHPQPFSPSFSPSVGKRKTPL